MAPFLLPFQQQVRGAKSNPQANKKSKTKKKEKGAREFKQRDLKDMEQYSLCDAMRCAVGGHCPSSRSC